MKGYELDKLLFQLKVELGNTTKTLEETETYPKIVALFNAQQQVKVEAEVKPEIAEERENILLSDLIRHLRTDFDDGEVISYRIKVKQPFSTREIRYPSK